MASRGIRKIDENVIGVGRTLITLEKESFDSVEPGTMYVDAKSGKVKVKIDGEKKWSNLPQRGIFVGNTPPPSPEPGDLWLDTNTNVEINEEDLDLTESLISGSYMSKQKEAQMSKMLEGNIKANFLKELNNPITINKTQDTVKFIGGAITNYDPSTDILIVKKGTTVLTKNVHYTVNEKEGTIKNMNGSWEATREIPTTFDFMILRNSTSNVGAQKSEDVLNKAIEALRADIKKYIDEKIGAISNPKSK